MDFHYFVYSRTSREFRQDFVFLAWKGSQDDPREGRLIFRENLSQLGQQEVQVFPGFQHKGCLG
jgi:hypothetical protein